MTFSFKGKCSTEFSTLVVQELPDIVKPKKRVSKINIDGQNGAIYQELGYEDIEKTILIGLKGTNEIDDINEWLDGSGELILSNEPDKIYDATVHEDIVWSRKGRFREGIVTVLCKPFKRQAEEIIDSDNSAIEFMCRGNYKYAYPELTIIGSGTMTVNIDNQAYMTLCLGDAEVAATINSEKKECKINGKLNNRAMNGNFLEITQKEPHSLEITGGHVTQIRLKVNSIWT